MIGIDNMVKTEREHHILMQVIKILKESINPDKIILFGSRVKKTFNKNSDFDIAVDRKKLNIRQYRIIMEKIKNIKGLYKVDLIFLKSVEPKFKDIVLKTGAIIYER